MATKAPAKSISGNENNLDNIIELHTAINELSTVLKTKKSEFKKATEDLSKESRSIFDTDLGAVGEEEAPEVFGNHEFPIGDRLITVNYKMAVGGLTFTQVGGRPASEVLPELLDTKEYKKLFKETTVLKEPPEKLVEVHGYRPELIGFRLTGEISEKALEDLRGTYPEIFTPYVKDEDAYIETIGGLVETEVTTAASFIEKVSKLSDDSKFKLKDFIRKVLGSKATSAVKVGNKASA